MFAGFDQAKNIFEGFGNPEKEDTGEEEEEKAQYKYKFKQINADFNKDFHDFKVVKDMTFGDLKSMITKDLIIAADRDLDGNINFNEYLLIRKALIAWSQCTTARMNRSELRCALTMMTPYRNPEQNEVDAIFKLGMNFSKTVRFNNLSFPVFVLLSDL
jgi:hypothetical protein